MIRSKMIAARTSTQISVSVYLNECLLTSGPAQVTQDYNAAFTGLNAAMIDYYGGGKFKAFSDCGLDLGWSHPNASNPPQWPENDCYHTCATTCAVQTSTNSSSGNSGSSNNNGSTGGSTGGAITIAGPAILTLGAVVAGVASLLL
jgi:hypothetical protein